MAKHDTDQLIDDLGLAETSARRNVAAILFTYRCSINCRHCLFGCAGTRPDVAMTPRQCADALALLHETGRVIHIAGGEAMLYWDRVAEAIRLAHAEGNAPHFIETNCSFASDDRIVRERLEFLARHGVKGLLASCDPFHQEFVPAERFLRARRIAVEIFGEKFFWGSREPDDAVRALEGMTRDDARLRDYVRSRRPIMVGTAARMLARYLDTFAPDDPALPRGTWRPGGPGPGCAREFQSDTMWEFHIDPYGNIQTNCGIILGSVQHTTPAQLLARGPEKANRFVEIVSEQGPRGLAELARRDYGFTLPERVTQSCELCFITRRFLHGVHPEVFGPSEIYG